MPKGWDLLWRHVLSHYGVKSRSRAQCGGCGPVRVVRLLLLLMPVFLPLFLSVFFGFPMKSLQLSLLVFRHYPRIKGLIGGAYGEAPKGSPGHAE